MAFGRLNLKCLKDSKHLKYRCFDLIKVGILSQYFLSTPFKNNYIYNSCEQPFYFLFFFFMGNSCEQPELNVIIYITRLSLSKTLVYTRFWEGCLFNSIALCEEFYLFIFFLQWFRSTSYINFIGGGGALNYKLCNKMLIFWCNKMLIFWNILTKCSCFLNSISTKLS